MLTAFGDIAAFLTAIAEILLIFLVLYTVLWFLRGTRGAGVFRGLILFVALALLIVLFVVDQLGLYRLEQILDPGVLVIFLVPVMILFQPEFRRVLIRLGEAPFFRWFFRSETAMIAEIIKAAEELGKQRIGGLIALEGDVGLGTYVEGGVPLDAAVSSELLVSIFWPGTPLHDGAVIIREDRIAAAGCLFPLTENPAIARHLGTRHRAAIGVTEDSDAVAIVVSEESQEISVAHRGKLIKGLDRASLERVIRDISAESRALAAGGGQAA